VTRLPIPGQDDGTWGDILNDFLKVEHNSDGTLKNGYIKPSGGIPKDDLSADVQSSLDNSTAGVLTGVDDITGTGYTFTLADAGKLKRFDNASAIAATIPPNSSVAFLIGTVIEIAQTNTGQLTVVAGAGVTVNGPTTLTIGNQWAHASLIKTATNRWLFIPTQGAAPRGELGYAERTTADTTTNTSFAAASSNKITGLSVSVTGTGRPVEIEFFLPAGYHSVANSIVGAVILQNGTTVICAGNVRVSSTTTGDSFLLKARKVLTAGTGYTFEVGKYTVSGTANYSADATYPMYLAVTER
jgi:hypothetical protein